MTTPVDDREITGVMEAAQIDPDVLDAEAEALTAAALEAIRTPPALFLEAAQKKALAAAERKRLQAVEGVRLTSLAVSLAEDRYGETEEPERTAAGRAFEGLQALQRAHAARRKAVDEQAPVDQINRIGMEIKVAEETAAELDAAVELAVYARQKAFEDLEQCRRVRQQARALLEQAEAAVASPGLDTLPEEALKRASVYTWPYRVWQARMGGEPLTADEEYVYRGWAALLADQLEVIPEHAKAVVAAEVLADVRKQMHHVSFSLPDGRQVNLGQALGMPGGGAGR